MMTVLKIEPREKPELVTIDGTLEDLQKAVGGYIEAVYPFDDNVAIVCNEEGKLSGLEFNRALRDEHGDVFDVIAGAFLIVGLEEDSFGSLTAEQQYKYEKMFHAPEAFIRIGKQLVVVPI